jgi:hypothetical protein
MPTKYIASRLPLVFKTELEFQIHVIHNQIIPYGDPYYTDYPVGDGNAGPCQIGYVDLFSRKGRWFVECKLRPTTSAISHALGQCLFYRHFLPDCQGFIVYPELHLDLAANIDLMERIFWDHRIILCSEDWLTEEIARFQQGKPPQLVSRST